MLCAVAVREPFAHILLSVEVTRFWPLDCCLNHGAGHHPALIQGFFGRACHLRHFRLRRGSELARPSSATLFLLITFPDHCFSHFQASQFAVICPPWGPSTCRISNLTLKSSSSPTLTAQLHSKTVGLPYQIAWNSKGHDGLTSSLAGNDFLVSAAPLLPRILDF